MSSSPCWQSWQFPSLFWSLKERLWHDWHLNFSGCATVCCLNACITPNLIPHSWHSATATDLFFRVALQLCLAISDGLLKLFWQLGHRCSPVCTIMWLLNAWRLEYNLGHSGQWKIWFFRGDFSVLPSSSVLDLSLCGVFIKSLFLRTLFLALFLRVASQLCLASLEGLGNPHPHLWHLCLFECTGMWLCRRTLLE